MSATKAYTTVLSYGGTTYASGNTWVPVTVIEKIEPPAPKADDIDVTVISSANEAREFIPGWANGGECKLTVQWDSTQSAALYALFRTMKGWKIIFPDTHGVGFTGYINEFGTPVDEEGIITNEITIKVTGLPVEI